MSVVSDVRGVLQDLIVPDLKALQQRVEALEKRMNERFEDIDRRFDRAERDAERRHAELISYLSLEARIRKIEAEQAHDPRKLESNQPHETRS
ncbi:MAG: hypothetical protein WAM71_12215 [Candidatus Korobacteraceae bacterium]